MFLSFSKQNRSAAMLGLIFAMSPAAGARGDEPKLSISGYDPVAYFTDGRPVQGKAEYEYLWHKLRWRFASSEHRELFSAASPPTTSVVSKDGRHLVMVGAQTPRDAAGDLVGKGDMRAQVEQVGKNVDAGQGHRLHAQSGDGPG